MDQIEDTVPFSGGHRTNLLDLPAEVFQWMVNKLRRRDRAALLRACRKTYALASTALYRRTYTKRGSANDISALPEFFARRPDLIRMVKVLVIDEYDETAYRRLLSVQFPNLENILMQHDGPVEKKATEEEKDLLNQALEAQPKLQNSESSIASLDSHVSRSPNIQK